MNRREFLTTTGLIAASGLINPLEAKAKELESSAKESFSTQLLVVGGGPAGVCAAVAASRLGIQTLIIDGGNCLGGMATKGLVSPFMTSFDTTGKTMVIRGLFEEIVDRMVAKGGAIHPKNVHAQTPYTAWIKAGHNNVTPFEPECLKRVMDEICQEAKVHILFHADFVKPLLKGQKIVGAQILTQSGLENVSAQIVIDATGDGTVAYRAGVPCTFGNEKTGQVQPSSLFFHINNVDSAVLEADVEKHLPEFRRVNGVSYRALHWCVAQAEANGEWDLARKSVNIFKGVQDDEWAVNCSRVSNINATDSESLTKGEIEGRRQVEELMKFFHKYVPGCKGATLTCSASTLGIRESRHVMGEFVLNANDLLQGQIPEDSILMASNSIDVHGGPGTIGTTYTTIENGRWYGVPFRCLLPKNIDNLLVAGRCLSAQSDAAGAVRVVPPSMAMGQAAGTAAALALKGGLTPKKVDISQLTAQLKQDKVFLEKW